MARRRRATHTKGQASVAFQFKITLVEIDPAIWRPIQVADCTLDRLHQDIQSSSMIPSREKAWAEATGKQ